MDAADPLCAVSSATSLLYRTFGGPAPAASPSKADEALLRGISGVLRGSNQVIEQAKIAMKEQGDILMVYQHDGGKAAAAANGKNNQLARRPAGERKRHQFTMRVPASKPLPVVDRSVLDTISDPDEYFATEAQLDKAEAEIKRLSGAVQPKKTLNFEPVVERKRRTSSQPRKSYIFSSDAHTTNANMISASQSGNMIESQTSQDDAYASVSEENEQSVPSRFNNCSDGLAAEDLFAEKDKGDGTTDIMAPFQNFDGPDTLDFLRKTIGIREIRMEKNCGRDSILGDMPLRSTARINRQEVGTLERPLSGSHQARVSELAQRILGDAAMDKHENLSKGDELEDRTLEISSPATHQARVSELAEAFFRDTTMDKNTDIFKDDEFECTSDTLMGEQSLAHDYSMALMTDETFSPRRKDREAPNLSAKSAERVLDPESNMPHCATIADPCSSHNMSTEEGSVHMDYTTTDNFNNEAVISSHHLEDSSTEMLADTPGINVAPDDITRTSHSSENNIQHQEVVEEDGVVQDTSVHSLEIPLEDIGPQNQSQAPDGTVKGLIADLRNPLSPTKEKAQNAARGKTGQQPTRGKKVADEPSHSLEIPQEDSDSENQHTQHVNTEGLIVDLRKALSPAKENNQGAAQRGKTGQRPKRGRKVADESRHSLDIPQEEFDSENQSTHHVNTEGLIANLRNALSPAKEKTQGATQRGKPTQQPKRGKKVSDESRHSLDIPQEEFDSENQPTLHVNSEGLIADIRNALSPAKEKMQEAAQTGKARQRPKRGEKVADESSHSLEIPQADSDSENQPHKHDVSTEQQAVITRIALSPNKPKEQNKVQRRSRQEKLNKRTSLADAGHEWQSGLRRSTRVRHRPLEHWRGERFVYGRIHNTMVTVIGVKSYSPDGDNLKVKSFVPEQYSDIVNQGAKY